MIVIRDIGVDSAEWKHIVNVQKVKYVSSALKTGREDSAVSIKNILEYESAKAL